MASAVPVAAGTTDPIKGILRLGAAGSVSQSIPAVSFGTGIFVDRDGVSSELVLYIG